MILGKIRMFSALLAILLILSLPSCGSFSEKEDGGEHNITDVFGSEAHIEKDSRIVSCVGSFAECVMLAGGSLVGVTSDAAEEQGLELGADCETVGSTKNIDLERLIALEPDYVILSADLAAHLALKEQLEQLQIPHGYFRTDTFSEYKAFMGQLCDAFDTPELYEKNVVGVEKRIAAILAKIPEKTQKTVLLLRAFSNGARAKSDDNLAGMILKELGLINIADKNPLLLEELSVEYVVSENPDLIFISTMGSEDAAIAYIKNNIESNAAWRSTDAVKDGKVFLLPKELFHYKPNNRWDESYEYLAKIIYPELFE